MRCGRYHQASGRRAENRNEHAKSKPPAPRTVIELLPEEGRQYGDAGKPKHTDGSPHEAPENFGHGCADVEMAGRATGSLKSDDGDLQDQNGRHNPSHRSNKWGPDPDVATEPG